MGFRGFALSLLLLAGCQQGAEVEVRQANGVATVEVTRDGKPACIDQLDVYAGEPKGGPPDWFIISAQGAPCASRVTLGQTPPGFEATSSAPLALKAGTSYLVEVSGGSFIGSASFVAAIPSSAPDARR